jgi:hypothetical protein
VFLRRLVVEFDGQMYVVLELVIPEHLPMLGEARGTTGLHLLGEIQGKSRERGPRG